VDERLGFGIEEGCWEGLEVEDGILEDTVVLEALLDVIGTFDFEADVGVALEEVTVVVAGVETVVFRFSLLTVELAVEVFGVVVVVAAEDTELEVVVDFVGVVEGEAFLTKVLGCPELSPEEDGDLGMLDEVLLVGEEEAWFGDDTPASGDRALREASFRSRLERSKPPPPPPPLPLAPPPNDEEEGLPTIPDVLEEEEVDDALSGEVLLLAERDVDLDADLDPIRDPAEEAGGVGSKPSISAVSRVTSSVRTALTFESTSCNTSFA